MAHVPAAPGSSRMHEGFWSTKGRDENDRFLIWLGVSTLISVTTLLLPGLNLIGGLVSMWVSWVAAVRRGHDMGRSAAFTLVAFVLPAMLAMAVIVVAFFALFSGATDMQLASYGIAVMLLFVAPYAWYMCARGQIGDNDYGADPRSAARRTADPARRRDPVLCTWFVVVTTSLAAGAILMFFSTLR